jgi:hypothetical protein
MDGVFISFSPVVRFGFGDGIAKTCNNHYYAQNAQVNKRGVKG